MANNMNVGSDLVSQAGFDFVGVNSSLQQFRWNYCKELARLSPAWQSSVGNPRIRLSTPFLLPSHLLGVIVQADAYLDFRNPTSHLTVTQSQLPQDVGLPPLTAFQENAYVSPWIQLGNSLRSPYRHI
jgi:hypothetical protein